MTPLTGNRLNRFLKYLFFKLKPFFLDINRYLKVKKIRNTLSRLFNNENVMCANFGDPRSRDRKLRHKKTGNFWLEKLLICL